MPLQVATLYTRVGCCLCHDAQRMLERHGWQVVSVDVDQDPELARRYGACVPVVVIDGRERFRGRIDPILLKWIRPPAGQASQASPPRSGTGPTDSTEPETA